MEISARKPENKPENRILIGIIISDRYISEISPLIETHLFKTKISKNIINWALDYFKQYKTAPHQDIMVVYEDNVEAGEIEDSIMELIGRFLQQLSSFYREDNFNEEYEIDQAIKYLRKRQLQVLKSEVTYAINNDSLENAEDLIEKFRKIKREDLDVLDVFQDVKEVMECLEQTDDVLFRFPGALGEMCGDFVRDDLVSFAAPAKRGKTWWLIYTAILCSLLGLRVVMYSFEMPRKQMLKRINQFLCGGFFGNKGDQTTMIPYFEYWEQDEEMFVIDYKEVKVSHIDSQRVQKKLKAINHIMRTGRFKLITAPPNSMNCGQIKHSLDELYDHYNFVPDVIILDYADYILPSIQAEYRHKVDDVWKSLKSLARQTHTLVVTATHTNKTTHHKDIKQGDESEDSRKGNHVSAMIALNQTEEEKEKQITRASITAGRHMGFLVSNTVTILQNLTIGKTYIDSRFSNQVKTKE